MRITKEDSEKIESYISEKQFTLQDIVSLLDNLYTNNQIRYHINKYYPSLKSNLIKEYSRGGTKLEYILKEIFPYNKIEPEFQLGERLRVDFLVLEPFNLAFEFDGSQHKEYSAFFHGSRTAFEKSKERDLRKEVLLTNRGINLIRIDRLDFSKQKILELVDKVGYGNGVIVDQSLLTPKEKRNIRSKELQKLRKQRTKSLKTSKPQESKSSIAYKESLKERQREYRKQQYQRQKEWLKKNKK